MLKTVKNGCGIRVDPPPLFFQNSHIFPFFLGGSFPKFKVNCDPWTEEGVYQGSYTLKEVMILTHNQLGLKLGKLKDNKFFL